MSWSEDAKICAESLTDEFGEDATYKDASLPAPIPIKASVGKARKVREYANHGTKLIEVVPVIIDDSEVAVRIDGIIVLGTATYAIRSIEPSIGGRTICTSVRTTQHQIARKGYRG